MGATAVAIDFKPVALEAVLYVQGKMTVGAGNKAGDLLESMGLSYLCVAAERTVTKDYEKYKKESFLRLVAAAAEAAGCGNCGEQAATAFVYLLDKGIRPLDLMALEKPGDHNFVVIGRVSGSDVKDPATWGPTAIVCDAWEEKAYDPNLLFKMWHHKSWVVHRAEV